MKVTKLPPSQLQSIREPGAAYAETIGMVFVLLSHPDLAVLVPSLA